MSIYQPNAYSRNSSGACTCVIQTVESGRVQHLAVNACLFPLVGVEGKHVITIEGLGDAENPHPLQERIAKLHGSQWVFPILGNTLG
jgi:xanthine dehydrogenase/oxidase